VSYYDRQYRTDDAGLAVFTTPEDHASEDLAARVIEAAWKCKLHRFPHYHGVDWYAERAGSMVAVLELKTRSHSSTKHETVWLNVRKWLALGMARIGLGVPSLFVVQFTDELRYVDLVDVDGHQHRIAGCKRIVKSPLDIEPVIDVPVSSMKLLTQ
jgi:hypothetical protein